MKPVWLKLNRPHSQKMSSPVRRSWIQIPLWPKRSQMASPGAAVTR